MVGCATAIALFGRFHPKATSDRRSSLPTAHRLSAKSLLLRILKAASCSRYVGLTITLAWTHDCRQARDPALLMPALGSASRIKQANSKHNLVSSRAEMLCGQGLTHNLLSLSGLSTARDTTNNASSSCFSLQVTSEQAPCSVH
jgi:hypothetical protein